MIIFGIVAGIAGFCALCWLLFNLAVVALPLFVSVSAGMAAIQSGAGPIGAIVVGLAAGTATLALGQLVFTTVPSRPVRIGVAILFAAPAAFAGYHAAHGVAALVIPSETWRQTFSVVGAFSVGLTALGRMAVPLTAARACDRHSERVVALG